MLLERGIKRKEGSLLQYEGSVLQNKSEAPLNYICVGEEYFEIVGRKK